MGGAEARNPAIRSAQQKLEAAKHQVDVERAQLLPKLDGVIQAQHEDELFSKSVRLNSATIGVTASVPIYEGGAAYAQIRAAREAVADADKEQLQSERDVRQDVSSAWAALAAARAQRQNFIDQIKANDVALRDTGKEVTVGPGATISPGD